eukprot:11198960-Lingulodinium_polyedra.AAC.1
MPRLVFCFRASGLVTRAVGGVVCALPCSCCASGAVACCRGSYFGHALPPAVCGGVWAMAPFFVSAAGVRLWPRGVRRCAMILGDAVITAPVGVVVSVANVGGCILIC